ncbi:hypothetical protein AB0A05_07510 [Streptomyces sp. NPDC046374]|uniref:hypothetical protein n=1 Tax=Streptomyces sp. NPDC046374 TaxID=3154917 RepID=UPI0033FE7AC0
MDLRPSTLLQRLGIAPERTSETGPEAKETEEAEEVIPAPTEPMPLRIGDRVPDWWAQKPVIYVGNDDEAVRSGERTVPDPRTAEGTVKWINGVPHHVPPPEPPKCEHPNPHAVHARPTGKLVAYWCEDCQAQLEVPDDYDELDDAETDGDEDGEAEDGEGTDKVPAAIRRRWSLRGSGAKTYARPSYGPSTPQAKQSLMGWWTSRSPQSRWLLYNGTALAGGFALGIPQFFTAEVAYLVATYHSWTDFYVAIWYGLAIAAWVWDYRTRSWLPPFALAARIPLISMVIGSLLYGAPVSV